MKISKKAIEKNNENFPPLDPNEPNQNDIKHSPDKPSAASINISEEEVIKSFDNFQFKETPTQKVKCANIQNETSNSCKKTESLKRKDSSSSQSSTTTITIKPRKKKGTLKERKNSI